MSRQVRNIHLYLPAIFLFFFFIVDADDVIQQAAVCLRAFVPSIKHTHEFVSSGKKRKSGRGKKEILPASLSCSELDGIDKQTPNKRNTTQTLLHH